MLPTLPRVAFVPSDLGDIVEKNLEKRTLALIVYRQRCILCTSEVEGYRGNVEENCCVLRQVDMTLK